MKTKHNSKAEWSKKIPESKWIAHDPDTAEAETIFKSKVYGMWEAKEKLLEKIASGRMNPSNKSRPILLHGPEGVGKSVLVRALAEALHRPYFVIKLGMLKNDHQAMGSKLKRTGCSPSVIIQGIIDAGVMNPVIHIEDAHLIHPDTMATILAALDPDQNHRFMDRFFERTFDLSKVQFVLTTSGRIPNFFRSACDEITAESFTYDEKIELCKEFLIPKVITETGIKELKLDSKALGLIVNGYTAEPGVTDLYKQLSSVSDKLILMEVRGNKTPGRLDTKAVKKILGSDMFWEPEVGKPRVGYVSGLYWDGIGGGILQIEGALIPGDGSIAVTGSAGDVLLESSLVAWSYIKTSTDVDPALFRSVSAHINLSDIAMPKEGPSASLAIAIVLMSLVFKSKVASKIGVTGEMTLRGDVCPVGGIKEKITAAVRNGLKTVIIPYDNRNDVSKIREGVRKKINIVPVRTVDEAAAICIGPREDAAEIIKRLRLN